MGLSDRSYFRRTRHTRHTPLTLDEATRRPVLKHTLILWIMFLLIVSTWAIWELGISPSTTTTDTPAFPIFTRPQSATPPPLRNLTLRRTLQPPSPDQAPSPRRASQYWPYLDAVVPADPALRTVAAEQIRACPAGDITCTAVRLYRYVQSGIGYINDPVAREYIQPPATTLQVGAGDCEDLSILLASLLENVGIPTYLVFTPDHAYILACEVDPQALPLTIADVYTTLPPPRISETTRWLDPHTTSITPIGLSHSLHLSLALAASDPIDWVVVPTEADAQAFTHRRPYRHYPTCSREQVTHYESECDIDGTAAMVVRNRSDQSVRLTTTLRYQDPPTTPTLPALHTYRLNGRTCLTLDPSIKGTAYPGQVMDHVRSAPTRIAVNRAGHQVPLR